MRVSVASTSFHDNYIDVVLEGISVGFSRQYLTIHDQAFAAAEENSCSNILIDASRIQYQPDPVLEHNTAVDLAHRCKEGSRVAVVVPSGGQRASDRFDSTAQSRDLNVRAFTNREEAVAWLLH